MELIDNIRRVVTSGGVFRTETINNGKEMVFSTEHDDYRSAIVFPAKDKDKIISSEYSSEEIRNPAYWLIKGVIETDTRLKVLQYKDKENPETLIGATFGPYTVMIVSSKAEIDQLIEDAMKLIKNGE